MKARDISALLLASLLTVGAANGQTPPPGADPHHPASEAGSPAATEEDVAQGPASSGAEAGMGAMMSPEMMRMMMQMMMQHHLAGQMPMQGMSGGMQPGMGGMADGAGIGPEVIFGLAPAAPPEMTPERVQSWLQERLDQLGNPRLTLGAIGEAPDGSITAEIRTVDGSLVQKLAFNRFPGFVRQID